VTGYGLHIFPQHAALLEASAISPDVSRARGYVSVDAKKRLEDLGFERYQRSVPGLLYPAAPGGRVGLGIPVPAG